MQLTTKNQRDLIGIDSLERGIVFALTQIRNAMIKDNEDVSKILIFQEIVQEVSGTIVQLIIDVKLPYDSNIFNSKGGDCFDSIKEVSIQPVDYQGITLQSTIGNTALIPPEPSNIDTVEKYLAWCLSSWISMNKQQNLTTWASLGYFSFLEEAKPASFSAKVSLKFDYETFNKTNNLIQSVIQSVKYLDPSIINADDNWTPQPQINSLVGDTNLFGDIFLVGD